MGIMLLSIAYFIEQKQGKLAVVSIICFEFFLINSIGSLHWVYLPEFLNDTQFGFIATCHFINGIEISLVTEFMVNSWKP